ncbi:MAG: hopanoid-associated sugar epimerase [Acidithiobacillus sp.]
MKVLLTGASGFVGSAVLRRLRAENLDIRLLLRTPSAALEADDVELCYGDLADPASLKAAVQGCQALFHVAADYRLWVPDSAAMMRANVDGTIALLEAALAAGVERIVYTSSVAVLGFYPDGRPSDEEAWASVDDMIGSYKRSKFLAEEAVRRIQRQHQASIVIVNPSTPVGPGDVKPTPTGRMVRDAALGRVPAYVDTGLNIVHVDDVAEGHWQAFQHGRPGERYILGGDNLSLASILTRIAGLTGRPSPRLRLPRKALYPIAWAAQGWVRARGRGTPIVTVDELRMAAHRMYFSSAKAEAELGYRHRPAEEALRDAVRWFLQAPPR